MYLLLNQWPGFVFLYHMPLNPWYWKVNRGPSMCALFTSLITEKRCKSSLPRDRTPKLTGFPMRPKGHDLLWGIILTYRHNSCFSCNPLATEVASDGSRPDRMFFPFGFALQPLYCSAFPLHLDRLVFMCSRCSWSVMDRLVFMCSRCSWSVMLFCAFF